MHSGSKASDRTRRWGVGTGAGNGHTLCESVPSLHPILEDGNFIVPPSWGLPPTRAWCRLTIARKRRSSNARHRATIRLMRTIRCVTQACGPTVSTPQPCCPTISTAVPWDTTSTSPRQGRSEQWFYTRPLSPSPFFVQRYTCQACVHLKNL